MTNHLNRILDALVDLGYSPLSHILLGVLVVIFIFAPSFDGKL